MTIAYREKLQIQPAAIDQLVQGTQGDIRQILNILSTWKMTEDSLSFDEAKKATKSAQKNVEVGLFDLTASFFGGGSRFTSVSEKLENYFYDYSFVPLMVQENYIKINTDINSLSAAADSISEGDLVEAKIRGVNQSWALAPSHGILSCVRPTSLAKGSLTERIDFTRYARTIFVT
jgi:replication factor C subunit 1